MEVLMVMATPPHSAKEVMEFYSRNLWQFPGTLGTAPEQVFHDPKDGDLCMDRVKPREIEVEARSDPDVQIGRQIHA